MRRNLTLAVLCTLAVGLAITSAPLQAIDGWSLRSSWVKTQEWVSSVTPEVVNPMARLVTSLLPPRLALGGGGEPEPIVRTDKWNYNPGETALITGSGFVPGETVWLQVVHTDGHNEGGGHERWPVAADDSGAFESTWFVNPDDSLGATFLLTADGDPSALHAEYLFYDANPAADLDQCANGRCRDRRPARQQ